MAETEKLSYYNRVVRCIILANDKEVSEYEFPITKLEIHKEMFKVPYAFLELQDGGRAERDKFSAGDSEDFAIGSEIVIKLGDVKEQIQVFKGVITKQAFKIRKGISYLQLECKDKSLKMTYSKSYDVIQEKTDSDIIGHILSERYSDITSKVEKFGSKRLSFAFNDTSDWDVIMMLSDANGKLAIIDDGSLEIKEFKMEKAKYHVSFEHDIIDMTLDTDIKRYAADVEVRASDSKEQKYEDSKSNAKEIKFGGKDFNPKQAFEKVFGSTKRTFYVPQKSPKESEDIAKALHTKALLAQFQGSIKIVGNNQLKVGDLIEVKGVNKNFTGTYLISGITHTMDEKDWKTELHIGLSEKWYLDDKPALSNKSTSGIHIPIKGLHNAKVVSIHEDKNGYYRVKVHILHLQEEQQIIWARPAQFYAYDKYGSFFMPEVGSEVIVGFINEDPEQAVILGSLYNETSHAGEYRPDEENTKKAILTKGNLRVEFDDKDKVITIVTNNQNQIVLSEKGGEDMILIKDKHENTIKMDKAGILIETKEKLEIKAKDIDITASNSKKIDAKSKFNIKTSELEIKSQTNKTSGQMVEIKGEGMLDLKGGMIKIG